MSRRSSSPSVLVADIGGTNARFQVWQLDDVLRPSRLILEKVGAVCFVLRRCRVGDARDSEPPPETLHGASGGLGADPGCPPLLHLS